MKRNADFSTQVLIAENDRLTADLLATTVEESGIGLRVAAVARSFKEAKEHIQKQAQLPRADILLLDLDLGDGSGLNLIPLALEANLKVLVLTIFGDEQSVIEAIEKGAHGYLLKDATTQEVTQSIVAVMEGDAPISAAVAGHLLKKVRNQQSEKQTNGAVVLTPRETEVLEKLARGYTYREVGQQCGITYNTVSFHVKQIYEKLHANSRSEAIFKAVNGGLINMA